MKYWQMMDGSIYSIAHEKVKCGDVRLFCPPQFICRCIETEHIDKIIFNNTTYYLQKPVVIIKHVEEGDFRITCDDLSIDIYAKSPEKAKDFLNEEFDMIYRMYGIEDDSKLTSGGKELKEKILSYIEKVEVICANCYEEIATHGNLCEGCWETEYWDYEFDIEDVDFSEGE